MNISFDGMNQWTATFATSDAVEGHVVKMTAGATASAALPPLSGRGTPAPCSLPAW